MSVIRFGVSMEQSLVDLLDSYAHQQGFENRSVAIRNMVRSATAVQHHGETSIDKVPGSPSALAPKDAPAIGVLHLIYPHGISLKRVPIHTFPSLSIQANLQLHIQTNLLLKIIVVKGIVSEISAWAAKVANQKGVFGQYSLNLTDSLEHSFG